MSRPSNAKLFHDPIHGSFVLHPLLVKIVDTPEFQRLRNIKQLGGTYYVYSGGSHNRFEHCIGVSYIAGKMMETLREKQPELDLEITDKEVLCVQIAGLCHDLGHGPFSHVFDQYFIPEISPGTTWKHEQASVNMFRHLLEKNQQVRNEFERWNLSIKEHGKFIEELIVGEPDESSPLERRIEKRFLYEIVNNKENGIDVDKWDYFARDSHSLGIPSNFDMGRTMHFVRVIKCGGRKVNHTCPEGTTHICMRDNEVYNLYEMFHTRYSLHKRAYQHNVVKGVELMITDALVAANDHLTFHGKKMSEAIDDMDAYIQLTDEVFQQILQSTGSEMEKARNILHRLQTRDLYKCIDKPCDDWKREDPPTLQKLCEEIVSEATPKMRLSSDDIHILVVCLSYGMESENPMDRVLFYTKDNRNEAFLIPREEVSPMLPKTFLERHIRVYVKEQKHEKAATDCFEKWWDKQPKDKALKIEQLMDENTKLKKKVRMLQQQLEQESERSNSENRRQGRKEKRDQRSRPY